MKSPLALTFEVLAHSSNDSANDLLITALDQFGPVSAEALKAIVTRRSKRGHLAVLHRWQELGDAERQLVLEQRGRLAAALRDAVLADDSQLFANACRVIELTEEYDLVPNLVTLAEHSTSPHAVEAAMLVLRLSEQLSDQLPDIAADPRNLHSFRSTILDSLKRSLDRYRYHKRPEILEAFCLVCQPQDTLLLTILDDPHHPCYKGLSQIIATSNQLRILDLLVELLQRERTPATVLSIAGRRTDRKFICHLLEISSRVAEPATTRNLKRLRTLAWLNTPNHRLSSFDESGQVQSIPLLQATGVAPEALLEAFEELLLHGTAAGRAAACTALGAYAGDHTNHLILQAVYDSEPEVQAAAARQLRDRHIPGTMPLLNNLLQSRHEVVRAAAREALAEFSFENFLKNYDGLSEEARHTTGSLVQQVDEEYLTLLTAELEAKGVKRRLRAIEIARLLEVVPFVVTNLLELLEDEDHVVRAAAAEALQFWPVPEVQAALELVLHDRSVTVQNAARNSLAVFQEPARTDRPGLTEVPS